MEAVLPIKIPSLRVLAEAGLEDSEWAQHRFDQLNLIEEKRLTVMCHGQLYQKMIKKTFDKKVKPRIFKEGDLVLKKRGKWASNYKGPYMVKWAFSSGALILTIAEGIDLRHLVNADSIKMFYP
ncbi:hypothetical protein CR513_44852, partial [Mucuna pruriens]